jgi:hypothetical protein
MSAKPTYSELSAEAEYDESEIAQRIVRRTILAAAIVQSGRPFDALAIALDASRLERELRQETRGEVIAERSEKRRARAEEAKR